MIVRISKMSELLKVFASSTIFVSIYTDWSKSLTLRFGHVTSFFSFSQFSHVVALQT